MTTVNCKEPSQKSVVKKVGPDNSSDGGVHALGVATAGEHGDALPLLRAALYEAPLDLNNDDF
jgi:hypothetical protein